MRYNTYHGNGIRERVGSRHIPSPDEHTLRAHDPRWYLREDRPACAACHHTIVGADIHYNTSAAPNWVFCVVNRTTPERIYTPVASAHPPV